MTVELIQVLGGQNGNICRQLKNAVILLHLHPASLTHKNPQRQHVFRRMQRTIDRFEDFLVEHPVRVISVAVV